MRSVRVFHEKGDVSAQCMGAQRGRKPFRVMPVSTFENLKGKPLKLIVIAINNLGGGGGGEGN
jgi:hypothetical protein